MKSFVSFTLLFLALVNADEYLSAKFEMIPRTKFDGTKISTILDSTKLKEHKADTGFYTGKMRFFANSTASYRQMIFDNIGVTEVYARGIPVVNGKTQEKQKSIFAKTTTCTNYECSYMEMFISGSTTTYYNAETFTKTSYVSSDYIVEVKKDTSGNVVSFMTQDNIIYLTDVTINRFTPPTDFFGNCISRTCSISLDMVFSLDISGSMSWSDINSAHDVVTSIAEAFELGAVDSTSSAAMIKWNSVASLSCPTNVKCTLNDYMKNGLITNKDLFVNAVANAKGGGSTCISCGYKAAIETSYTQYIYEGQLYTSSSTKYKSPELYGRLALVITDGEPNLGFGKQSSAYGFTVRKEKTSPTWSYKSYQGTDYTTAEIGQMKDNANTFYSQYLYGVTSGRTSTNNDYIKFFQRLTILALGVNEAGKGTSMDNLFTAIGQPGPVTSTSFSTFYKITDLKDSTKQKEFFNELSTNVCTGYQGILTQCTSSERPCCGDSNKCGKCEQNYDPCKGNEGTIIGDCNCHYSSSCNTTDACKVASCDSTKIVDACTISYKELTLDEIRSFPEADSCNVYQCKSDNGRKLEKTGTIDCNALLKDHFGKDCVVGATCKSDTSLMGKNYKPANELTKDEVGKLCQFAIECSGSHCQERIFIGGPDDDRTDLDNYSPNIEDRMYYEENCYDYTCNLEKSTDSNVYDSEEHTCENYCQKCEYDAKNAKNNCVEVGVGDCQDPTKNPYNAETGEGFDPSTMFEGCSILPTCDSSLNGGKGGCSNNVDLCAQKSTTCIPLVCNRGVNEAGEEILDENGNLQAKCVENPITCTMPMYYDPKCYTPACNNEMGGCVTIVDYDKLNACGECSDFDTCDESSVVVAASISAGVVAGIVIAAVVALSVGLIASKRMYDMIAGAQEASMDAAQENALYQSDDKGGDNPLFSQ